MTRAHDATVCVPVRDVDLIRLGVDPNVGRGVETCRIVAVARLPRRADLQKERSAAGKLASAQGTTFSDKDTTTHQQVIKRYCVGCHNERTKTAGLMLDQVDLDHQPVVVTIATNPHVVLVIDENAVLARRPFVVSAWSAPPLHDLAGRVELWTGWSNSSILIPMNTSEPGRVGCRGSARPLPRRAPGHPAHNSRRSADRRLRPAPEGHERPRAMETTHTWVARIDRRRR